MSTVPATAQLYTDDSMFSMSLGEIFAQHATRAAELQGRRKRISAMHRKYRRRTLARRRRQ